MFVMKILFLVLIISGANAEFYDRRCSCVCPGLDMGPNRIIGVRAFYQDNEITAEECNCKTMVIPRIEKIYNGSLQTYCLQCDCHFEMRNTTVLLIVVISLMGTISTLVVYMACLHILQKVVKRRNFGNQRRNEEQLLGLLNIDRQDSSDEET